MSHTSQALDSELIQILGEIVGPDDRFGHREHVHLAFLAVRRNGMPAAITNVCEWIKQIANAHGTPHKYHYTVTRGWVELVAHHVQADPQCSQFETFANRNQRLLDKRLLVKHYRSTTLASKAAREHWIEPDLLPFPWAA
jgi:hypothetical protein